MPSFQMILVYFLLAVILVSAFLSLNLRGAVGSVLALVLAFISTSVLFITIGMEFMGLLLALVYVGAILLLFLFVVMMIDPPTFTEKKIFSLKTRFLRSFIFIFIFLFISISSVGAFTIIYSGWERSKYNSIFAEKEITLLLGEALYSEHIYDFFLVAIILLVAVIAAVMLTLRKPRGVLHQSRFKQITTNKSDVMELRDGNL